MTGGPTVIPAFQIEAMMQSNVSRLPLFQMSFAVASLFFQFDRSNCFAQESPLLAVSGVEKPSVPSIQIPDQPTTVDPATLFPAKFSARVTVKFDGQPLKDVFSWLQRERTMNVIVDYSALASAKLLDTEPIYEELNDAPLFLLLNRLKMLGVFWYEKDDALYFTSQAIYLTRDQPIAYFLGDLFDQGYSAEDTQRMITRCSGGIWASETDSSVSGTASLIGDVLFVRQTDGVHREIAGLLAAIRHHGRRTYTFDAPRHVALRAAIDTKVTVDFQETPLIVAIQELSKQAQVAIRLDRVTISRSSVKERTSVSLKLSDQKLGVVFSSMLSNLGLAWYLKDEVIWVTTDEVARHFQKAAVFDVRDLCRDQDESIALKDAITKQTRSKWRPRDADGGSIEIPHPGTLVVRHTEHGLDEVLQLLENYRTGLRASKLRVLAGPEPKEIVLGYYRLTKPMADQFEDLIQNLILPETWKSPEHPDAIGSISKIEVQPTLIDAKGQATTEVIGEINSSGIVIRNSVLVIRQTRSAHQMIAKLINALLESKAIDTDASDLSDAKSKDQSIRFGRGLMKASDQ